MSVVDSQIKSVKSGKSAKESQKEGQKPVKLQPRQQLGGLMTFARHFSKPGVHPFDELEYQARTSKITEPDGTIIFEMKDVEVPASWSQLATDIMVSKYFRKAGVPQSDGSLGSEKSAKQVVTRLARTIRKHGEGFGVFATPEDAEIFEMELSHLLITQKGAFNSPVWFNCGLWDEYKIEGSGGNWYWNPVEQKIEVARSSYEHPQCSACFIQSVDDDLMSIFDLIKNEARLFKFGSGTGTNFSRIRGKQEKLSGGGTSSGLMSFLEVLDRGAGATKSGGTTRRAAKMVCLDMDHPEIMDFILWKQKEEKKVKVLIDAGYSADFNGEAYHTVAGQNSNNSVRLSDKFMNAYLNDEEWQTTFRTTGEVCDTYKAKDLMQEIAKAAWACADPGVQYDDIINDWNTALNTDRIYGSNPCSEYHFLNNTACNLASINLTKFLDEDGNFDVDGFRHACRVFFTAQEILVDFASYPTEQIAKNSHDYRPLGLGYANLGTLLMLKGIPYDSEESYAITGAITAIMHGEAYRTSAELAAAIGPFPMYKPNESSMLRVMNKHRDAVYDINTQACPEYLLSAAKQIWDETVELGERFGYRNAQATVLAPTGTIGLLMDCDTTGIEPDFALVKWKKLAGGGYFKIVNQSVPAALKTLGYNPTEADAIVKYILGHGTLEGAPFANETTLTELGFTPAEIKTAYDSVKASGGNFNQWTAGITPDLLKQKGMSATEIQAIEDYVNGTGTVEGAPYLKLEHYPVFDCANKCGKGERFIDPMAHIKIMAAAQPFLSGAISKTVNLPNEATVEDIEKIYVDAWKMGLKCVALYRDGSKWSQPLNTAQSKTETEEALEEAGVPSVATLTWGKKKELPRKRNGFTLETSVSGHKIHLRTGEFEDGRLGEIFIDMFKEGAAYRSMVNCFAVAVSLGLQYGVPLEKFVDSFTFTRFEPSGMTDHANIKQCTSVVDLIFRVLGLEYLGRTDFVQVPPEGHQTREEVVQKQLELPANVINTEAPKPKAIVDTELSTSALRNEQLKNMMGDAPFCSNCGSITIRNGACYKCDNCGNSEGCS